jgi:CheY-like chemotaxis protein
MDTTSNVLTGARGSSWAFAEEADRLAMSTILVVEDDREIRDMLVTLLELSGVVAVACDTAEQGLEALREQPFDLVLTDYSLPRRTGLWLLKQAEAEGLIENTPVLIVTAQPRVSGAHAYEVIHKPFDLDDLVERVRERLAAKRPRHERRSATTPPARNQGNGGSECPEPVELILYVSSQSPRSAAAIRNIQSVLSRLGASRVKITVCDLSAGPTKCVEDGIALTATFERRTPGPRTFILGHITNPELLLEMIGDCELEP